MSFVLYPSEKTKDFLKTNDYFFQRDTNCRVLFLAVKMLFRLVMKIAVRMMVRLCELQELFL